MVNWLIEHWVELAILCALLYIGESVSVAASNLLAIKTRLQTIETFYQENGEMLGKVIWYHFRDRVGWTISTKE